MSDLTRGVSGLVAVFVILYPCGKPQNKIIFDVLVCRRKAHCSRCNEEEEHRWVCYQGDYKVDSVRHLCLEVGHASGHVAGENAGITVAVPSPSASNSEIPSNQSQEGTSSSDIQTQFLSLGNTLRVMQDSLKTMNHKLLSMEQQQVKLNEC